MFPMQGPPPTLQLGGGGAPAGASSSESNGPDSPRSAADIDSVITILRRLHGEEKDAADQALILDAMKAIQKIKTGRQQEADQALGMTAAHKFTRRNS